MARTLQQMLADRDRLTAAIANPNQRVSAEGKAVDKRSIADLLKARDVIDQEIATTQDTGAARVIRTTAGSAY